MCASTSFTANFEQDFFVAGIERALPEKREPIDLAAGNMQPVECFLFQIAKTRLKTLELACAEKIFLGKVLIERTFDKGKGRLGPLLCIVSITLDFIGMRCGCLHRRALVINADLLELGALAKVFPD